MTGGKSPYTLASFAPVALLSTSPMVIVVNASGPIKDWAGMLAELRANPAKLTIGHPGNGSTNHLAVLQLQKALGVTFNIVPYKSNGLALNDLLAGQIDSVIDQIPASIGHVCGNRLRAIAARRRSGPYSFPTSPRRRSSGSKTSGPRRPSC
jgi:tripartite-type tricarboxylate transporter receptor subunit TctC